MNKYKSIALVKRAEYYPQLVQRILGSVGYKRHDLLKKIWNFYSDINYNDMFDKALSISSRVLDFPDISAVYGVGHPFYGEVGIRRRIYVTYERLLSGELTEDQFFLKILPDFDFFLIYKQREGPYSVYDKNMDSVFEQSYMNQIDSRLFIKIRNEIADDLNLARVDHDIFNEFMNDRIHVDFIFAADKFVEKIPLFPTEFKRFIFLRDIYLSMKYLAPRENSISKKRWETVMRETREHFVLSVINDLGKERLSEVLDHLKALQPHNEVISLYNQTQTKFLSQFQGVIDRLEEESYIEHSGDFIWVTESGEDRLLQLIFKREDFIKNGIELAI
jgi:hypothetical protein